MENRAIKYMSTASLAVLSLAVVFSIYMAFYAWVASIQTGTGAAQGDLGFYLVLWFITPILLIVTGIPYVLGLYAGRSNIKSALTSWVSRLFYLNTAIIIWCWYYVFNLWH
jgi:hypothetical protein